MFRQMNRGKLVFLNQATTDDNSILKVIAPPTRKGNAHILSQSQLTLVSGRTIGYDLSRCYLVTLIYYRALVNTGSLISAHKFHQGI